MFAVDTVTGVCVCVCLCVCVVSLTVFVQTGAADAGTDTCRTFSLKRGLSLSTGFIYIYNIRPPTTRPFKKKTLLVLYWFLPLDLLVCPSCGFLLAVSLHPLGHVHMTRMNLLHHHFPGSLAPRL